MGDFEPPVETNGNWRCYPGYCWRFSYHQQSHKPDQERLLYKLQQTDSSYRYTNGTQGTAWILIQENPIKGYGYGNDVYDGVYNKRVVDYPT